MGSIARTALLASSPMRLRLSQAALLIFADSDAGWTLRL
jgi:hypothetical protein